MSQHQQKRCSQLPAQNWRGVDGIISMETRILPKKNPPKEDPLILPTAQMAMRVFPQVQIPVRNVLQSMATPPMSGSSFLASSKRPQSFDFVEDPTPSKRHRIDILAMSPTPKSEPQSPVNTLRSSSAESHYNDSEHAAQSLSTANEAAGAAMDKSAIESMKMEAQQVQFAHKLGTEMVKFRFGDVLLPSSFHQKVILDKIPAFREEVMRMDPMTEEVEFPMEMADVIPLLVEWCYTSVLPKVTPSTTREECYERIKLYCLAGDYRQVDLMNQCMDFITDYLRESRPRWDVKWVSYVYTHTFPGSPLRTLASKWYFNKFMATEDKGKWSTEKFATAAAVNGDLIFDVLSLFRVQKKVKAKNPKKDDPSAYHVTASATASPDPDVDNSIHTPMDSETERYDWYEVDEDKDQDFYEEEAPSEAVDDHLPLTRSARRAARAAKRALTAPA